MEELGCQKEPGSVERYGGALSWLSTVSLIVFFFFVGIDALTLLFCTIMYKFSCHFGFLKLLLFICFHMFF